MIKVYLIILISFYSTQSFGVFFKPFAKKTFVIEPYLRFDTMTGKYGYDSLIHSSTKQGWIIGEQEGDASSSEIGVSFYVNGNKYFGGLDYSYSGQELTPDQSQNIDSSYLNQASHDGTRQLLGLSGGVFLFKNKLRFKFTFYIVNRLGLDNFNYLISYEYYNEDEDEDEIVNMNINEHVSFSGGGWRMSLSMHLIFDIVAEISYGRYKYLVSNMVNSFTDYEEELSDYSLESNLPEFLKGQYLGISLNYPISFGFLTN